jgi:excisionase family DNA binding protein
MEGYLTTEETAQALRITGKQLAAWIRDGKLPAYRVPGTRRWLIKPSDVEALLKASQ